MQEVCYVNCVRNELERHHVRFSSRLVRLMVLLSALFLEIWDGGTQDRARGFRPFSLNRQLLHTGTYE